jgi:hypothetical protein
MNWGDYAITFVTLALGVGAGYILGRRDQDEDDDLNSE